MVALITAIIGALLGWIQARRAGAKSLDQAHYAGVGAIIGATLGILALIILSRLS